MTQVSVIVRCVMCKATRPIDDMDIDQPICRECWAPMYADRADARINDPDTKEMK